MLSPSFSIDHVCGSAHGLLAPYWSSKLRSTSLLARQVSARGGELGVDYDESSGLVKLRGSTALVGRGHINMASQ